MVGGIDDAGVDGGDDDDDDGEEEEEEEEENEQEEIWNQRGKPNQNTLHHF